MEKGNGTIVNVGKDEKVMLVFSESRAPDSIFVMELVNVENADGIETMNTVVCEYVRKKKYEGKKNLKGGKV